MMSIAMDNVVDDLIRIAKKCDRAFEPFESGAIKEMNERLLYACNEVAMSWCGSNIGYHATLYLDGFRKPRQGEFFDREWGMEHNYSSRTRGSWLIADYDLVRLTVMQRAGVSDLAPIVDAATHARGIFDEAKEELLPTLDAMLTDKDDAAIREQREKLAKLDGYFSMESLARDKLPRGQFTTRDSTAISHGLQVAHHQVLTAWVMEQYSCGKQANEVGKIARYAARYLQQKLKIKGNSVAKTDGRIFIGHGRSAAWNALKDSVRDRLGLDYDEFNREAVAGLTIKERLLTMLDKACFAFLVMTAEDEHADGTGHARENVIHEIGLFQGRLGFERAIVLLEEGCQEFSNIEGVQHIRFAKGNLEACHDKIRQVLEREGIVT
jgi:predicted nucleotide-binding protein